MSRIDPPRRTVAAATTWDHLSEEELRVIAEQRLQRLLARSQDLGRHELVILLQAAASVNRRDAPSKPMEPARGANDAPAVASTQARVDVMPSDADDAVLAEACMPVERSRTCGGPEGLRGRLRKRPSGSPLSSGLTVRRAKAARVAAQVRRDIGGHDLDGLEADASLSLGGAVVDVRGNLDKEHYKHFIPAFKEADKAASRKNTKYRGMRPGESKPDGLRPWLDPRGAGGWIAPATSGNGRRSRWFNMKVWGSWRFSFLLARLQAAVWRSQKRHDAAPVPRNPKELAPAVRGEGPLFAHFSQTEFAQDIVRKLDHDGFAVLRGVLRHDEADAALSRMWDFVETVSPTVRRTDSSSWYPHEGDPSSEPWPHTAREMFQEHQAGWVFGHLRELLAVRVFEPLYGTKALHCSKDGFCFQRPTRRPMNRRSIDHFDQSGTTRGLHCVQGSVSLLDQSENDGCFSCWPGSHRHHAALAAESGRKDWYMLSDADKDALIAAGCAATRVPVGRGDVVLWRSDLAHCGASPIGVRDGFRAVVYICMLPASMTPEALYTKKRGAYEQLRTGSHWPNKEDWFRTPFRTKNGFDRASALPFFEVPPALSPRLEELYGLRCYGGKFGADRPAVRLGAAKASALPPAAKGHTLCKAGSYIFCNKCGAYVDSASKRSICLSRHLFDQCDRKPKYTGVAERLKRLQQGLDPIHKTDMDVVVSALAVEEVVQCMERLRAAKGDVAP